MAVVTILDILRVISTERMRPGFVSYLHERREEVAVSKVRGQRRVEASGCYGEGCADSLEAEWYWGWSVCCPSCKRLETLLLRPLRITVSRVAMKSVMTASASCRPARTEMMSELGFVYFLVRAASRKAVKV